MFQPFSLETSSRLQDEIKQTINNFEPRVKIESILVDPNLDTQEYTVEIAFYVVGMGVALWTNDSNIIGVKK